MTGRREYQAIVVGASFAGLAVARELRGEVLLLDRYERPLLLLIYWRLARREEREAEKRFGHAYRTYRARVPMLAPRLGRALELERATASFSIRS